MLILLRDIALLAALACAITSSAVSRKGVFVVDARYEDPGNLVANISMGTPCMFNACVSYQSRV